MPTKKLKRDAARAKAPPPADPPQQDQRQNGEGASGRSGRGADSVLAHLIEQEKTRASKPGRS